MRDPVVPTTSNAPHDKHGLLSAPIKQLLPKLTLPMAMGMVAILLFNLVDTFFVAQLGTNELAAVSLTFPVTFSLNCIMLGMGVGLSTLVGRKLGEQKAQEAQRLATHGVIFTLVLMLLIGFLGWLSIDPIFRLMGASPATLDLLHPYMSIWFWAAPMLAIPMVGNSAIRATGDTKTPAKIMMSSAVLNAILDPILIFGLLGVPKFGMTGAAIATAISWGFTLTLGLYVQIKREKLLGYPQWGCFLSDVKRILKLALPVCLSNLIGPVTGGVILALLARLGTDAVAAYGAAMRIESLMLLIMIALSSAILPFMAQNLGAKQPKRAFEGLFSGLHFAWGFQLLLYCAMIPLSLPIAHVFTNNPNVITGISHYLWIVPLTYGALGNTMLLMSAYNALHHTHWSLIWNLTRSVVILLPCVYLGSRWGGMTGVFIAIALTHALSGIAAYFMAWRLRHQQLNEDVDRDH